MRGSSKAAGHHQIGPVFHRLKYAVHAPVDITLTTKEIAMRKARFTEHQIIAVIKSLKPDEPLKMSAGRPVSLEATYYIYGLPPFCKY
jgi:putative transposase